jgi:hypothetical protein
MHWRIASSGSRLKGNYVNTCDLYIWIDMIGGMKVWFLLTLNNKQFVLTEHFLKWEDFGKEEWGLVAVILRPGE